MHFNGKSKKVLAIVGLAGAAAVITVGAAFAITSTVLAGSNTVTTASSIPTRASSS
jgi:hypothetical protein